MKKIFTRLIMVLIVVLIGIGFKSYKLFSYSFEKKSIRVEKETTLTLKDTKQANFYGHTYNYIINTKVKQNYDLSKCYIFLQQLSNPT